VRYPRYFREFCDFVGMAPDDIAKQRREDLRSEDASVRKRFEGLMIRFDVRLREKGLKGGSRRFIWSCVKSFFAENDLDLKFKARTVPVGGSEDVRAATKDDIRTLLNIANVRERAIIMFAKDSGLSEIDIADLNVGDVDLEKSEYVQIRARRRKTGVKILTFIGPEAIKYLTAYQDYRKAGTQKIFPEKVGPESPLFRQDRPTVERIHPNNISTRLNALNKSAGLKGVTPHSFRRYFQTRLEAAGVHKNWVKRLMGHKMSGGEDNLTYSRPIEEELQGAYMKAYHELAVETSDIDMEKLHELEKKVNSKDEIIEALLRSGESKEDRIGKLETLIQEVQKVIPSLIKNVEDLQKEVPRE